MSIANKITGQVYVDLSGKPYCCLCSKDLVPPMNIEFKGFMEICFESIAIEGKKTKIKLNYCKECSLDDDHEALSLYVLDRIKK